MKRRKIDFSLNDPNKARFRRFCAEWSLDPGSRQALKEQCQAHPEWGITVSPVGLSYQPPRVSVKVGA